MIKFLLISLITAALSSTAFSGEKVRDILQSYKFTQYESYDILTKFPELNDVTLAAVWADEVQSNEELTLKLYAEDTNDVFVIQKNQGQTEVEKQTVSFQVEKRSFQGEIHGTLLETIKRDIKNERIAHQLAAAFKDDFTSTKGLRVPAYYSFDVIEFLDNGLPIKYGDVLQVTLVVGKAEVSKVLKQDLETLKWDLVSSLSEIQEKPFYVPVRASRISSLFNLARRHPVKRRIQPHNGIDFVAKGGTAVYPALEGEIIAMGRARAKGKYILIQHDNGYQTTYDHLRSFSSGLQVGMRVDLDTQIGEVGRTGYATGAHLHFGILKDGLYVNPLELLKDYRFDQKEQFESFESAEAENSDE